MKWFTKSYGWFKPFTFVSTMHYIYYWYDTLLRDDPKMADGCHDDYVLDEITMPFSG